MDKRKSTKKQAMIHKTSHRQLKIEQQEQHSTTQTTKDWGGDSYTLPQAGINLITLAVIDHTLPQDGIDLTTVVVIGIVGIIRCESVNYTNTLWNGKTISTQFIKEVQKKAQYSIISIETKGSWWEALKNTFSILLYLG